jgi:hypothetical protein
MAELKTQKNDASVQDFLAKVADDTRRADCYSVLAMMQEVTGEAPSMWGASIVGFGTYRYQYASGQSGEWPIIGFSPRKNDLTLYIMPGFAKAEDALRRLGKHKAGKSCLYLKRLADVDLTVLREMMVASVEAMEKSRVRA